MGKDLKIGTDPEVRRDIKEGVDLEVGPSLKVLRALQIGRSLGMGMLWDPEVVRDLQVGKKALSCGMVLVLDGVLMCG